MQLLLKMHSEMANSVDPGQTSHSRAVWSGSALFEYIVRNFDAQLFRTFTIYRLCFVVNVKSGFLWIWAHVKHPLFSGFYFAYVAQFLNDIDYNI